MNQAASARPEGVACNTSPSEPTPRTVTKPIASLWLLAAHEALRTIGYHKATARDQGLALYVDTTGALYAANPENPPPMAVFVCSLSPGMDQVAVAARLRHTASRWRLDAAPRHEDND